MTTGASPVDLSCQKRDLCNNQSIMSPDPSHLKKKGGGYKDVTSSGSCDIAPESPRSKCPGSTGFRKLAVVSFVLPLVATAFHALVWTWPSSLVISSLKTIQAVSTCLAFPATEQSPSLRLQWEKARRRWVPKSSKSHRLLTQFPHHCLRFSKRLSMDCSGQKLKSSSPSQCYSHTSWHKMSTLETLITPIPPKPNWRMSQDFRFVIVQVDWRILIEYHHNMISGDVLRCI